MITTEQIKTLRDSTGISVMQCKKALEEAGGDSEKALVILRKKGGDIAAKKADRTLGAGVVSAYIHGNGSVGAMVELSCETDFVSKNDAFKALAYDIAMHVAASSPLYLRAEDVAETETAKAREVFAKEVEGKPAAIQEKIMQGKLASYFGEKTLLEQPFIKNPELTIKGLIDSAVQKFGEKIEIARFTRFSVLSK
ncbi:MAG: Elongation factor Ts [Candidatus Kaiserbacteria bacterium GW2011_GWA2_49_19]|uniref:Elongation factor Ts n=1 Tax=Candidatus Kaiserbacteria bacterium GW2011_GWA2_49_19 TaxID=1618669 RepID=A0A0G1VT45_9BACT|nr:MAG: Elongation factor Ts [Candidatus Kaiserbacteria bacterium GW2011_GWA2_49_19]